MTKLNKIMLSALMAVFTMTMGTSLFGQEAALYTHADGTKTSINPFGDRWEFYATAQNVSTSPTVNQETITIGWFGSGKFVSYIIPNLKVAVMLKLGDKVINFNNIDIENLWLNYNDKSDFVMSDEGTHRAKFVLLRYNDTGVVEQGKATPFFVLDVSNIEAIAPTGGNSSDGGTQNGGNANNPSSNLPKAFLMAPIFVLDGGKIEIAGEYGGGNAEFTVKVMDSDMEPVPDQLIYPIDSNEAGAEFMGYKMGGTMVGLYKGDDLIFTIPLSSVHGSKLAEVIVNVGRYSHRIFVKVEEKVREADVPGSGTFSNNKANLKYYIIRVSYQ